MVWLGCAKEGINVCVRCWEVLEEDFGRDLVSDMSEKAKDDAIRALERMQRYRALFGVRVVGEYIHL